MAHEANRLFADQPPNRGVAQGFQLGLAFGAMAARKSRIDVTRMTHEFRDSFSCLSDQHVHQRRDADVLGMRLAVPLTVEAREGSNRRIVPERQMMLAGELTEMRPP